MKPSTTALRRAGALLTLLLIWLPPAQATQLVSGDLGHWLRSEGAPKLTRLINRHPRFKGESIEIVALKDGEPVPIDNELASQLQQQLQQQLLSQSNIRIPIARGNCRTNLTNIVLGIDISQHNNREHKVLLALIDVDEGIWINQASQVWVGRLTPGQKRRLVQITSVSPGAFYPDQTEEIAQALSAQLECRPPLASPIFLDAEEPTIKYHLGQRLVQRLVQLDGQRFVQRDEIALTTDRSTAETIIKLKRGQSQIDLLLETGFAPITIATVKLKTRPLPLSLLSTLNLSERKRECRGHGRHCTDVGYELYQDAYVFQFYTRGGDMVPLTCEVPKRQKAGRVSFGLKVKPTPELTRPSLGYYLLATDDLSTALEVARHLKSGSRHCGSNTKPDWISDLSSVIKQHQVSWRALHLNNSTGHIRVL